MKGIKKILMVLMVLSMVVVFTVPASAAYKSLSCEVMRAGYDIESGNLELMLRWATKTEGRIFKISFDPVVFEGDSSLISVFDDIKCKPQISDFPCI